MGWGDGGMGVGGERAGEMGDEVAISRSTAPLSVLMIKSG